MKEQERKNIVNRKKVVASIDRVKFTLPLKNKKRELLKNALSCNYKKSIIKAIPYTYIENHVYLCNGTKIFVKNPIKKEEALENIKKRLYPMVKPDVPLTIINNNQLYRYEHTIMSQIKKETIRSPHSYYYISKQANYLSIEINDILQIAPDTSLENHLRIILKHLIEISFLAYPKDMSINSAIDFFLSELSFSEMEIAIDMTFSLGFNLYDKYISLLEAERDNIRELLEENMIQIEDIHKYRNTYFYKYNNTIYSYQSIKQNKLHSIFKIYNRSQKDRYDAGHKEDKIKDDDIYRFEVTLNRNTLRKIYKSEWSKDINAFLTDNSGLYKNILAKHLFASIDDTPGKRGFRETKYGAFVFLMYKALTNQKLDVGNNVFKHQTWYNELRDNLLLQNRYYDTVFKRKANTS